jgi:type I restriction enzyme S subunit
LAANAPAAITDGPFGSNLKSDHYTEAGPRVIRLQNIGDGAFLDAEAHISEAHFEFLRKHEACAGDVIVAMLGEQLPRACLVPAALGPAIVKADCVRLRVHPEIALPEYVMAGLNSQPLRRQAAELMHGVGRPRLGLQWFRGLHFPLAPQPEQQRIIGEIESYFTRLDDAVATLERVERNLKRYRASVLKSAVEGRLVPTEAALAEQEGRDYEPASVLLERILAERRRRWSESGKKGKYEEPTPPDTTNLPDLPEGWCWATADTACERVVDCHNKTAPYVENGIPLLRTTNIRNGSLKLDELRYVTEETYAYWSRRCPPCPGDVLFTREAPMGEAAIVPEGMRVCMGQRMMLLRADPRFLCSRYLLLAVQAPHILHYATHRAVGIGVQHLRVADVESLPVPLPPIAEQRRIADEAERQLTVIETLWQQQRSIARRSQRLRQSILKWAFEGKLADQDPEDEPASILLARIKAERETAQPAKVARPPRDAGKKKLRA